MSTGDVIAQVWLEKKGWNTFEFSRAARFAFLGCCLVGPVIRTWYVALEKIVGSGVTLKLTAAKVGLDQFLFAPIFTVVLLSGIGALQGQSLQEIRNKLDHELVDIVLTGWKVMHQNTLSHFDLRSCSSQVWPATQMINFYFVPFLVRPLVVAVVALFWNTYLAWKANKTSLKTT